MAGTTNYSETIDLQNARVIRTTTQPDPDGAGPLNSPTTIETYYPDGTLVESGGTAGTPVKYDYAAEEDTTLGYWVSMSKQTLVGDGGAETEWVKSYTDALGREYRTKYADNAEAKSFYNAKGQLFKQVDPDNVITLMAQGNGASEAPAGAPSGGWDGDWQLTVVDMDQDGVIDFAGTDRIARSRREVFVADPNPPNNFDRIVSTQTIWTTNSDYDDTLDVSVAVQKTDGLMSSYTSLGQTSTSVTTYAVSQTNPPVTQQVVTTTNPDGTQSVSATEYGRQIGTTTYFSGAGGKHAEITHQYDSHSRTQSITDTRGTTSTADDRTTSFTYDNLDRQLTFTTPVPDTGLSAQTTTNTYDALSRITQTATSPENGVVHFRYKPTGQLEKTWGTRTYPVEYTYDAQGRVKTLKTWQDFNETTGVGNAGSATTTWNYSASRGWLTGKLYDGQSTGPTYEYWPSGRLKKRTWTPPRNLYADYTYDQSGTLVNINYSDSTPDVIYTTDRRGRATTIADAVGTRTIVYNAAGQVTEEDFGTGLLDPVRIENHFDSLLRRDWNKLFVSNTLRNQVDFGYETTSSRHKTVSKMGSFVSEFIADYTYEQGGNTVQSVTMKRVVGGTPTTMATGTNSRDKLDRLKSLSWDSVLGADDSYTYTYNDANQRNRVDWADGSRWDFVYDPKGQVTSAKRSWTNPSPPPDRIPVAGQQFEFTYDDIGNRLTASLGGDANGTNLRTVNYTPNLLNQYGQREVSSGVDVMGYAAAGTVTMTDGTTNQTAYRPSFGSFYQSLWSWANNAAAQFKQLSILLDGNPLESRNVYIPKTPEVFVHDPDGNLLQDGRWDYEWDGENRLKAMQTRSGLPATLPVRRLEFTYDYMSRRIQKRVFKPSTAPPPVEDGQGQDSGSGGVTGDTGGDAASGNVAPWGWTELGTTKYVWDGWNLMAELNGTYGPMRTYAWGLDLSGSEQGAGGIGGLVFETDWLFGGGNPGTTFHPFYDGNGNLMSLRDPGGVPAAAYDYGAFGEILTTGGFYAGYNPFRFSTKFADAESGLLYYGYRYLNTSTGRWLSRDPLEEGGGLPIYVFVANRPSHKVDLWGLQGLESASVVVKSFIGRIGWNHGFTGWPVAFARGLLMARLTDEAFSGNPLMDTQDKAYRLYSRLDVEYECDCNGELLIKSLKLAKDSGKEGPLIAVIEWYLTKKGMGTSLPGNAAQPNGVVERWDDPQYKAAASLRRHLPNWIWRRGRSEAQFMWGTKGRPHRIADGALELTAGLRSSVWIWHLVSGRIECHGSTDAKGNTTYGGSISALQRKGSRFPTHRFWVNGALSPTNPDLVQGPLHDLWVSMSGDPSMVR